MAKLPEGRYGTHYETIPHNPCYNPDRCDCECPGCMRAYERWLSDVQPRQEGGA